VIVTLLDPYLSCVIQLVVSAHVNQEWVVRSVMSVYLGSITSQ